MITRRYVGEMLNVKPARRRGGLGIENNASVSECGLAECTERLKRPSQSSRMDERGPSSIMGMHNACVQERASFTIQHKTLKVGIIIRGISPRSKFYSVYTTVLSLVSSLCHDPRNPYPYPSPSLCHPRRY